MRGHRHIGLKGLALLLAVFPAACASGGQPAQELIAASDAALYRAKQAGRNRVVAAEPKPAGLPH